MGPGLARVPILRIPSCRLVKLGRFPTQVKLSERSVAWIESEVEAFTEARIAERDRGPASVLPVPPYLRMKEVMRATVLISSKIY